MTSSRSPSFGDALDAALYWHAQGWYVFPCAVDKRPTDQTAHGFKDAATTEAEVRAFDWHGCLVGGVPGSAGLVVLDYDPKNDADLNQLPDPADLATRRHDTPSGGAHFLFREQPGIEYGNSNAHLPPGFDLRHNKGYVILPSHGSQYETHKPAVDIADAPTWLAPPTRSTADALFDKRERKLSPELREGNYDNGMWSRVCARWAQGDHEPDEIQAMINGLDQAHDDPIGAARVRSMVERATTLYERGAKRPTTVPLASSLERRFLSIADLGAIQPPAFTVDGAIPACGDCMIVGLPSTLKSATTLDIGLCVAAGIPWHGREVRQGRVVYVIGEGLTGLHARIAAWQRRHGVEIDPSRFVVTDAVQLNDPAAVSELAEGIGSADLIVIDTLARCAVGVEENNAKEMGQVMHALGELRRRTGAATLTVHHAGWEGTRIRGSSAVLGTLDSLMLATRSGDELTIKFDKARDWQEADDLHLRVERELFSFVLVDSDGIDAAHVAFGDLLDVWPEGSEATPVRRSDAAARLGIDTERPATKGLVEWNGW